jgi:ABC-2 type transport system permease protein
MLISTLPKSLQYDGMVVCFAIILLSGFFSAEAMPAAISAFGYLMPLTYFLDIVRGIVLKGVGLKILMNNVIACLYFLCNTRIAIIRFKKNLE